MGFLGSLGGAISGLAKTGAAALPYATNAIAARDTAQAQGMQQQLQQQLQMVMLQRQLEQQAIRDRLEQAQAGHFAAQTRQIDAAMAAPKRTPVTYKVNDKGELVGLPSQVTPGQAVSPIVTGIKGPVTPKNPIVGSPEWLAAQEKSAQIRARYAKEPGVFVVDPNDPSGKGVYTPRSEAFGKHQAPTAGSQNPVNMAALARNEAGTAEMNNADEMMNQFEHGLATGTRKISAPGQLLGRVANSFTHDDPLSQLSQSVSLAALDRVDPDLARYIRRGLSFAEGEAQITQRPSDFRTKMAAFLSTAASGASPEMINDIQTRRHSILNTLNKVYPNAVQSASVAHRTAGHSLVPSADTPTPPGQGATPAAGFDPDAFYKQYKAKKGTP